MEWTWDYELFGVAESLERLGQVEEYKRLKTFLGSVDEVGIK